MKGLRLYLAPFAPDDSGAASVLYPLGGLVVICDAGGCAGNICGFDEPRWGLGDKTSAVFSAGLRDMDAIMGRDDRLLEKMKRACQDVDAPFAAIIGTPVPAVISTDFDALAHMGETRLGIPVVAVPTTGTHLYDEGISLALLSLFQRFSTPCKNQGSRRILGVLGATPLDLSDITADPLRQALEPEGWEEIRIYGMDGSLDAYQRAAENTRNLVYSPAGLAAAKWLNQHYGTPYEIRCPLTQSESADAQHLISYLKQHPSRVLVVHQQYHANAIRDAIEQQVSDASVTCATWFMQDADKSRPQDKHFTEEDAFRSCLQEQDFDILLADPAFRRALPQGPTISFIPLPHFAISGEDN